MNRYEKEHIAKMSPKYRPIGAWGYFGYTLLFSLPIIGFIAWLICACSGSNINRRSFARSYFCAFLIGLIIALVALTIILAVSGAFKGGFNIENIMQSLQQFFAGLVEKIKGLVPQQ